MNRLREQLLSTSFSTLFEHMNMGKPHRKIRHQKQEVRHMRSGSGTFYAKNQEIQTQSLHGNPVQDQ